MVITTQRIIMHRTVVENTRSESLLIMMGGCKEMRITGLRENMNISVKNNSGGSKRNLISPGRAFQHALRVIRDGSIARQVVFIGMRVRFNFINDREAQLFRVNGSIEGKCMKLARHIAWHFLDMQLFISNGVKEHYILLLISFAFRVFGDRATSETDMRDFISFGFPIFARKVGACKYSIII